jgi:hypothetical protein
MDYTPFVEVIEPAEDLKYGQHASGLSYWVKRHVLGWFRWVSGLLTLWIHSDKSNEFHSPSSLSCPEHARYSAYSPASSC